MYHELMQDAPEVVDIGKESAAAFKRTMAAFNTLIAMRCASRNQILNADSVVGIRAPVSKKAAKRGRPPNSELVNRSSLVRQKKNGNKIERFCGTCKSKGILSSEHRSGPKCPFYSDLNGTRTKSTTISNKTITSTITNI